MRVMGHHDDKTSYLSEEVAQTGDISSSHYTALLLQHNSFDFEPSRGMPVLIAYSIWRRARGPRRMSGSRS